MKKFLIALMLFCGMFLSTFSQDTVTIRPDGLQGKDAMLWTINPDNNYGGSQKFAAMGWTFYSVPGIQRAIIDFDLSGIPPGSGVAHAWLSLYFFSDEPTYVTHSGNNQAFLSLITGEWQEDSVTWNSQPATSELDQVIVPQSTDPEQDYIIDVAPLIRQMLDNPGMYHGMMLHLADENPYNSLMFASSDNENPDLRPMLQVVLCNPPVCSFEYSVDNGIYSFFGYASGADSWWWDFGDGYYSDLQNPMHQFWANGSYNVCLTVTDSCGSGLFCDEIDYYEDSLVLVLQPGPEEGIDALNWSINPDVNYGWSEKWAAMGWTFWGVPGIHRPVIDFDLSALPAGAVIDEAILELFFYSDEPSYVPHSGDNAAFLKLITSEWDEMEVTWNTLPSTTDEDQAYVPQSEFPEQNYVIDVTLQVTDMVQNPGVFHGLMLRLIDEEPYNCLMFASSDNEDPALRPRLTLRYHLPPGGYIPYTVENLTVSFFDNTPGATAWSWDFGDGSTSSLQNPVHTYDNFGVYTICRTVTCPEGLVTVCQQINLVPAGLDEAAGPEIEVYPNPFRDRVCVEMPAAGTCSYSLHSTTGTCIQAGTWEADGNVKVLYVGHLAKGIYFLALRGKEFSIVRKLAAGY